MSKRWKKFCAFVKDMVAEKAVSEKILSENVELEVLEGAGIGEAKLMQKRLVKANTNKLYRQKKYNLLREESEGYSKLITELGYLDKENVSTIQKNIQSLVGYFHLEPNRVFDVILDAYEADPSNSSYEVLLRMFRQTNLSQILGFKFQMYHRPEISSSSPKSLFRIAAILIANGKLDVNELLPHCQPPLNDVLLQHENFLDFLESQGKEIGKVSLKNTKMDARERMMAEKKKLDAKQQKLDGFRKFAENNQHFGLIAGMLELRLWKDAKSLCDKYAKMGIDFAADHERVISAVCKLIDYLIEPMYAKVSPRSLNATKPTKSRGTKSEEEVLADSLECTLSPEMDYQGMIAQVGPIINFAGHRLAGNVTLMCKIIRLLREVVVNHPDMYARSSEKGSKSMATRMMILRIIGSSLLPSVSLMKFPNPALICELWDILSQFPYKTRFDLYERWHSSAYETIPELQYAKVKASYDARQVLKRMANERDMMRMAGRKFAKVAHANPLVAFSALLNNIQSYDNLIPVVVDSIKYLTAFGFDCLAYLLLIYLSKDGSKLKADGTSHSNWLTAICKFAGYFYNKYPQVELGGLWHYLANQLMAKRPLDLLVLEEIVAKMTGLEVVVDFSDDTLQAMGGGGTLRTQARSAFGATSGSKKKPIVRLKDSLEKEHMIIPMLILVAQQREGAIYESSAKHLKLIGNMYDKSTSVLIQFAEFLATQVPKEKYCTMIPSLVELCNEYFVEPVVAFHIARPAIRTVQDKLHDAEEKVNGLSNKKSTKSIAEELTKAKSELEQVQSSKWIIGSDKMTEDARKICSPEVWQAISPDIYSTFWSLSLYDIFTPRKQYDTEIAHVRARYDELEKEEGLTTRKRNLERQRCTEKIDLLKKELADQISNHSRVAEKLQSNKDKWFPVSLNRKAAVREFLQSCIFPRALFSAEDALFCAKFVHLLHNISTPGFSTVNFFDKLARNVMACIFCVTEREASNLAIYLHESLKLLVKWRNDKKIYIRECESRPGFSTSFVDVSKKIKYDQFLVVFDRWHDRIGRLMLNALSSGNYMHVRQALIICSKVVEVYPSTKRVAVLLKTRAEKIAAGDERQDIRTMAKRYETMLKKLINSGKLREQPTKQTNSGSKENAAKPEESKTEKKTVDEEDEGEIKESNKKTTEKNKGKAETGKQVSSESQKGKKKGEDTSSREKDHSGNNREKSHANDKEYSNSNRDSIRSDKSRPNDKNSKRDDKSRSGNVSRDKDRSTDKNSKRDDKSRSGNASREKDRTSDKNSKRDDKSRSGNANREKDRATDKGSKRDDNFRKERSRSRGRGSSRGGKDKLRGRSNDKSSRGRSNDRGRDMDRNDSKQNRKRGRSEDRKKSSDKGGNGRGKASKDGKDRKLASDEKSGKRRRVNDQDSSQPPSKRRANDNSDSRRRDDRRDDRGRNSRRAEEERKKNARTARFQKR